MKTLVIISGVTGAIGSACLAGFSRLHNVTIIGISRKALPYSAFIKDRYLSERTLICNIGDIQNNADCSSFVSSIDTSRYKQIIYIHAVGIYPFELDQSGKIAVSHDQDGDGIDDRVMKLSYDVFIAMMEAISETEVPTIALIFGGIADKHHLAVHRSWWTVMELVKKYMRWRANTKLHTRFILLNISSVICPHEIITRPYVFTSTDADARFWLQPHEVANEAMLLTLSDSKERVVERDLFHHSSYFFDEYYTEAAFTRRKQQELGIHE